MAPVARDGVLDQIRLSSALVAARGTAVAIRIARRGGGTAAPGWVADTIDPDAARKLARRIPAGVIVVAGTNGKTTTCRMIATILAADGRRVIHNRAGSNLMRGVVSTFAGNASVTGQIDADCAVIESDEAALPEMLQMLEPRLLVLTNLFRDQLDRYGELQTVAEKWRTAFTALPATTTLAINADDPTLVDITNGVAGPRVFFGLMDEKHALARLPHAADSAYCFACGARLSYEPLYLAHLGAWRCRSCGAERPELSCSASNIRLNGMKSIALSVDQPDTEAINVSVALPGLYNVYNTLAATTAAIMTGTSNRTISTGLADFRPAFGRVERITYKDRYLTLMLAKNPVGFNELLRTLTADGIELPAPTLIGINDEIADGRDVSWLWDVDFEMLASGSETVSTTGIRSADMANRLKYASLEEGRIQRLPEDFALALDKFVNQIPPGEEGFLLMTYTAMLAMRSLFSEAGVVDAFWRQ